MGEVVKAKPKYTPLGAALELQCCYELNKMQEVLIEGPRGCVAGETELWDPVHLVGKRIDALARDKIRPWVLTTRGPVLAEVPFRKGRAMLWAFTTKSGKHIEVTDQHRFWARVCDPEWDDHGRLRKPQEYEEPAWVEAGDLGEDDCLRGFESVGVTGERYNEFWDPIVSKNEVGVDDFYDLHVPGPENYVANGLLNHNTGKTRALLEWMVRLCEEYPGLQVLLVRKTMKSMRESVLKTLEDQVLVGDLRDMISGTAKRGHRERYEHPNGSYMAIAGMDTPDKILSTEWHFIACFQAEELTVDDWEYLQSSLHRSEAAWKAPFEQIIADVNPSRANHWLNKRFAPEELVKHGRVRLFSKHSDNPSLKPDYLKLLASLTGARRDRFYLGKWVTEEGLIYPNWDPARHIIKAASLPKIKGVIGSMDWGIRAAGVFQVWGLDEMERMYRLAEVYRTGWTLEKWAWAIAELQPIYHFDEITADPSRVKDNGALLEKMLAQMDVNVRVTAANNSLEVGLDLVRKGLDPGEDGSPRILFVEDALCFGQDEELIQAKLPTCTEEEIGDYCWARMEEGSNRVLERPDKNCSDHGLDSLRYACVRVWRSSIPNPETDQFSHLKSGPWRHMFDTPGSLLADELSKKRSRGLHERPDWRSIRDEMRPNLRRRRRF